MRRIQILSLFGLCLLLLPQTRALGCSDPEQHKIHLRQEMESRLRSQAAGGGGAPTAAPVPSSALDSADAFFKAPAPQAEQGESRRRR